MIRFIENQTIEFRQEDEQDCGCGGRSYCQLAQITDTTEFQLLGSIANINPSFNDSITGWGQWNGVEISLAVLNATTGNCDGVIEATASEGSGTGYEYSIDGGAFSGTNTFTDLCPGAYLIKVKDSLGNQMAVYGYVYSDIDCSQFEGSTLQDLIDSENLFGNTLNCVPIEDWT